MKITFDRLKEWPGKPTPRVERRSSSAFTVTYPKMLEDLEYELAAIDARDVRLEADMEARSIRRDGWPYADAKPVSHPGIVLSFDIVEKRRKKRLSFSCDGYSVWWHNLRDASLLLDDLRAVKRRRARATRDDADENPQYEGYTEAARQIAAPETDPKRVAALELLMIGKLPATDANVALLQLGKESDAAVSFYRTLVKEFHPDVTGDAAKYTRIDQAAQLLGLK